MTITAELPFENSWDLTYDVEFATKDVNELYTDRGNKIPAKYVFADQFPEGTVIENKDVKSMAAGTNKVEYAITIPAEGLAWAPGKSFNYAVKFSNAVLNGKEIPIENPLLTAAPDGFRQCRRRCQGLQRQHRARNEPCVLWTDPSRRQAGRWPCR